MDDVLFEQGASGDALDWMEENMRELERDDFAQVWGSVRKGLVASVHLSEYVVTASLGGEVMGLFGVTPDFGEGHMPWLALTNQATQHPVKLVKSMRSWVSVYLDKFGYLHNFVSISDEPAIDLLEVVGFTLDREEAHLRHESMYYEFFALKGDI